MAPNTQQTPLPGANEAWDEGQLESALKRLDQLYVQARNLRTTIPRMTQPLTNSRNPSELYGTLMKSVAEANKEIQDVKNLMSDAESKAIFERAKASRKENPLGITPWDPTENPQWLSNGQ